MWVILYVLSATYSLTSTPNNRFLRNVFREDFINSRNFFSVICLEEIVKKIFFHISFWCLTWATIPGFTSNKPTYYLLDCGDYQGKFLRIFHASQIKITYPIKSRGNIFFRWCNVVLKFRSMIVLYMEVYSSMVLKEVLTLVH